MQLARVLPFALLAVASLAACLEIEEDVTVRPDGSVHLVIAAEGDRADLEDGFPLPTWGAWRGVNQTTVDWLCGAEVDPESLELALEADFSDVTQLPQYWAPPGEPYRSAGLSRTTELEVTCKGGRTIYVFTRVMGARRFADWSPSARIDAGLDDEMRGILEARGDLSQEQWGRVTALVRAAYEDASRAVLRSALSGVYTRGAAELGVDDFEQVVERVALAVGRQISEPRLHTLYFLMRHPDDRQREDLPPQFDLDHLTREVVRQEFPSALEDVGLAEGVRNAVLESLEWSFAALDQTTDLGDETIALRLTLPGRIVDGNFDALSDGRAVWKLDGSALHDRDVVLRAVSVVE
jgi:hypothetical protein